MLTGDKAARLARRATDWDSGGLRGLLGRRAEATLRRAGASGDRAAVDVVWRAWLAGADERYLALLLTWRRPAANQLDREMSLIALGDDVGAPPSNSALIEAAKRALHPIAAIARQRIVAAADPELTEAVCVAAESDRGLAEFCAEVGLAPADPVRRVMFFLLTGQQAQRRAADPDGSLLALGYAGAAEAYRGRLRAAMAASGDIDPLRVLASGGTGPADGSSSAGRLSAGEVAYLAERLAERRDWPELWRLAGELPLAQGIAAAGLIGDGWQPARDQDRVLLERLRRDGPGLAGELPAESMERGTFRVEVPGQAYGVALSADGRRLTAATRRGPLTTHDQGGVITVFRLPDGQPLERYEVTSLPRDHRHMVDFGDSLVVTQFAWIGPAKPRSWLLRCSAGEVRELERPQGTASREPIFGLARLADAPGGSGGSGAALAALIYAGFLDFYTADGTFLSREFLGAERAAPWLLGLRRGPASLAGRPTSVAAGPDGRLAVVGGGLIAVDGRNAPQISLLASLEFPAPTLQQPTSVLGRGLKLVSWCDADTLVTIEAGSDLLRRWRIAGDLIEEHDQVSIPGAADVVMIPGRGELAVLTGEGTERQVRFLRAESLTEVTEPRELSEATGASLAGCADGSILALGGDGFVQVVHPDPSVVAVASRPLAQARPDDLTIVRAALRDPGPAPLSRPLLALLEAALEHRFGADVAIGAERGLADDDIGLG
jgi:hypothetical protein